MPTSVGKQLKQYNLFYAAHLLLLYCDISSDGLIRNEKALKQMQFLFLEATSEPIKGLALPRTSGMKCMLKDKDGRSC